MGTIRSTALLTLALGLSGCAMGPPAGLLFSNVRGPLAVTGEAGNPDNHGFNCFGEASAFSLFGLVTFGDSGIDTAKKDGARRTGSGVPSSLLVTHVDYRWVSALGIGRYTTRVFFFDPNAKGPPCAS